MIGAIIMRNLRGVVYLEAGVVMESHPEVRRFSLLIGQAGKFLKYEKEENLQGFYFFGEWGVW